MVLANVIAFAILKLLHNLVSMQKSLFANNELQPEVSKITEIVQCELTFIFIELSETPNRLEKIHLVLKTRNVAILQKNTFLLKTRLHKNA